MCRHVRSNSGNTNLGKRFLAPSLVDILLQQIGGIGAIELVFVIPVRRVQQEHRLPLPDPDRHSFQISLFLMAFPFDCFTGLRVPELQPLKRLCRRIPNACGPLNSTMRLSVTTRPSGNRTSSVHSSTSSRPHPANSSSATSSVDANKPRHLLMGTGSDLSLCLSTPALIARLPKIVGNWPCI